MQLWKKIKQYLRHQAEISAKKEVISFASEVPLLEKGEEFPYIRPYCLRDLKARTEHKKKLTASYTYQPDDDLLAKKQDFIEQYTINEKEQFNYFIKNSAFNHSDEIRTHAWRDHEQKERLCAQRDWHKIVHRNKKAHLFRLQAGIKNR